MELDEERWRLVEEAITPPELKSDYSRLCAIWSVVESRKPLTASEIARGQQIARELGFLREDEPGQPAD